MPLPFSPLIVYSTPTFFSQTVGDGTWGTAGAITRGTGGGGFNRWDGTSLDKITDSDAAAVSYTAKAITFVGDGVKTITFAVARPSVGFSADSDILIVDTTAVANRLVVRVNFTTTTPIITITSGLGSIISVVLTPDGQSWDITCNTLPVIAANAHVIRIAPCDGPVAEVNGLYIGDISIWNSPLPGFIMLANSTPTWLPDKAYQGGKTVATSGVPETFLTRKDSLLNLTLRLTEVEWLSISAWIDWCFAAGISGAFDYYPKSESVVKYTCWLMSPKPGSRWGVRRVANAPQLYELDVVLRTVATNQLFDIRHA